MQIRLTQYPVPELFPSPYDPTPHPLARAAAEAVMDDVRTYMSAHPESELHRRGKMFGVLVYRDSEGQMGVLRAFSAMLDGTYHHDGFVEPVYEVDMSTLVGQSTEDSRQKQQWLFHQYRILNAQGETRDLIDIFRDTPPILSIEEYFQPHKGEREQHKRAEERVRVPSGAGECCAPKLLQAAYVRHLQPVCMAEFWMGASPSDELRIEGQYYPACTGKCKPILTHALQGIAVAESRHTADQRRLAKESSILYEDEWLLVVNKPSGLLSVPGKDDAYSLQHYLTEQYQMPIYAAHRLDQDTSGVIVYARTQAVASALQKLFLRRDIHKLYLAELAQAMPTAPNGEPLPTDGVIDLPLLPNPLDRPRQMVHREHGKASITCYQLTDQMGPHGGRMVALRPATGRTHQLRVHCAHPDGLNTPIYGDRLYGTAAQRLMLHAAEIAFPHPVTGEMVTIVSAF